MGYINWPEEKLTSHYIIGIYGDYDELYREFNSVARTLSVHGKPLKIKKLRSLDQAKNVHVVVLPKSENLHLKEISSELLKSGVLLISDDATNDSAIMINFNYPDKEHISFELNRSNIIYEGLKVSKEILLLGGTEIDVATIYKETEFELKESKDRVVEQKQQLALQQKDINLKKQKLADQKNEIIQKKKRISKQNKQIESATMALELKNKQLFKKDNQLLEKDLLIKEKEIRLLEQTQKVTEKEKALIVLESSIASIKLSLNEREAVLQGKQKEISELELGITQNIDVLEFQKAEINTQKRLIEAQKVRVTTQGSKIQRQQKLLFISAVTLVFILLLISIIFRGYRQKQKSNLQLEQKNQELNEALETLKQMQSQLVQSEKMASLGQLVASVAHEVNTPLGAIKSSANSILSDLKMTLGALPGFFDELNAELRNLFTQLMEYSLGNKEHLSSVEEREHRRLLTIELEPLLGGDADDVADVLVDMHIYRDIELWLPLLQHPNRDDILKLAYKLSGIERNAAVIDIASDKASKVVLALKTYSHPDQENSFTRVQVKDGIETVLTLYNNFIKHGVEVTRDFEALPEIMGSEEALNQVWTNIIHNALQAMQNKGQLIIRSRKKPGHIRIEFEDNGPGIPVGAQGRIFEPFFTTKASGEGTGIGLDISQKIVQKHEGKLLFTSEPGKTVFCVELPFGE